ncbi:MAG: hypothetical protein SF028_07765 [Candidatus Sumerlaeia bacterium]|nr:hypothetical protein [Candidatus Sumerlaeia bacterium]
MTPPQEEGAAPRAASAAVPLLAAAAALLWFAASWPFEITTWDDRRYIAENPWIRQLSPSRALELFRTYYFLNYHPLAMLSYALDYWAAGLRPWAYHLQSAAWHAGAVAALGFALRRLGAPAAALALLLLWWGLHPLRVESVVWLSGRKDVLCACFFLAAFAARLRAADAPERYLRSVFPLELALLLLALFSKSMAVTYGAVVLLWDALTAPGELRRRAPAYAAFLALGALFSWLNILAQADTIAPVARIGWGERILSALYSPWYYASRTLVPWGLSPLHARGYAPEWGSLRALLAVAGTLALLALGASQWRRRPEVAAGVGWYFLALAPVSGIIPVGGAFVADRYSYIPTAGLALALAAFARELRPGARAALLAALLAPSLALHSMGYMAAFRDTRALWERTLAVYPGFATARINLQRLDPSRTDLGVDTAALAAAASGDTSGVADEALAEALLARGERSRAVALLERSPNREPALARLMQLRAEDDIVVAAQHAWELLALPGASSERRAVAANILLRAGDWDGALRAVEETREPSLALANVTGQIANILLSRGEAEAARPWIARGRAIDPANAELVRALGVLHSATGDFAAGVASHRALLRRRDLAPEVRAQALGMLAFLHEASGGVPAALEAYREAVASGSRNPAVLGNYAALLEASGRRAEAAALAARAARLEELTAAAPPR